MQLQIQVDQKESIKRGIDAPCSTIKIEVNPADLTQAERDCIASHLRDGYRLDLYDCPASEPTIAGFREMIAKKIQKDAEEAERVAKSEVEEKEQALKREEEKKARCAALSADIIAGKVDLNMQPPDYYSKGRWYSETVRNSHFDPNLHSNPDSITITPEAQAIVDIAAERAAAEALVAQQAKKVADEARTKIFRDTIMRIGSVAQKARLERGLMTDDDLSHDAVILLTKEAFAGCPLPRLQKASEDDIDLGEYEGVGDEDLPEIKRKRIPAEADEITNELMELVLAAETALKNAGFVVESSTIIKDGVTRDADDIPWQWVYGLRLDRTHMGIEVHYDAALDPIK